MHKLDDARTIDIMLIEDNPGDVLLTKKAFDKARFTNTIHVANDGEVALKMLEKRGEYSEMATPDIILLDLNLPKVDGREVLESIKCNDDLRHIPVVVLSSSKAESDIAATYDLHANSYIVKPIDLHQFIDVVESIEHFWFSVVVYPRD